MPRDCDWLASYLYLSYLPSLACSGWLGGFTGHRCLLRPAFHCLSFSFGHGLVTFGVSPLPVHHRCIAPAGAMPYHAMTCHAVPCGIQAPPLSLSLSLPPPSV
ncbi:hypothetical protein LY78DRAFT_220107 [Colletotrichum sublineola]|nr:hypothetical protein LY78DRAFT_220107 [Colletotrichum sublineola]